MASVALSSKQTQEIAALVPEFPRIYAQAQTDWAKFKAGDQHGLFSEIDRRQIVEWFEEFPNLWEIIRPNWAEVGHTGMLSPRKFQFQKEVDAWVHSLTGHLSQDGLGLALIIIIAGIAIAAIFGIGGAIWAVGYVKRQNNISRMIDGTVDGRLPPEILQTAIDNETGDDGIFGTIKTTLGLAVAAGVVFMLWPQISSMFKKR